MGPPGPPGKPGPTGKAGPKGTQENVFKNDKKKTVP